MKRVFARTYIAFITAAVFCATWATFGGENGQAVDFGRDVITLEASHDKTTAATRAQLARLEKVTFLHKVEADDLRLLEDVQFFRELRSGLLAKGPDGYSKVDWRNVLLFVSPLQTRDQATAVVDFLHSRHTRRRAMASAIKQVMADIQANKAPQELALTAGADRTEWGTLSKGAFRKGDAWYVHLILLESTDLVEYKYILAWLIHAVQGPRELGCFQTAITGLAASKSVGGGRS